MSATARSTCSPPAGSSARRRRRSPRACRRSPHDLRPSSSGSGEEPGVDGLAAELALAGYERVERVDERGQFAVRGGIVDVFPSTGREPLRVELFGDEIEQVRAFSPFTQRALHAVDAGASCTPRPSDERISSSSTLGDERRADGGPRDLVSPGRPGARPRLGAGRGAAGLGGGGARRRSTLDGAAELDPFPRGQAFAFEAQRPAIAARGLAEAENELAGFVRVG